MDQWNEIYVTDKNGGRHFKTSASPLSTMPEIRNLKRKIPHCKFLDQATVVIMLNDQPYVEPTETMDLQTVLKELADLEAELGL